MRSMAWCLVALSLVALSLVGCQCGPRYSLRNRESCGTGHCANRSTPEASPHHPESDVPRFPAPSREGSAARRSRGFFDGGVAQQETRSNTGSTRTRTTSAEDNKPLLADLEKLKREKAELQTKLNEDAIKQTQQRLELEARVLVLQEQLRQQSVLQQVAFQQHQAAASRPATNYSPATNYNGPVISSSVPASGAASVPLWNAPAGSSWNSAPAATWNASQAPAQSTLEMWPHSPQRR